MVSIGEDYGSGAGSRLPTSVLLSSGACTIVAVAVSVMSIYLQLKNYRKPILQRMVIRIMIMVPLYAIASLISLFSLEAAFVIDAIRDIYEAFVIYCFFVLLLSYLGGERSTLILLHGRPPKSPVFPVSLFKREIDVSDPYTFLFLKRGILQYVQVKPVLAAATLILKACGKFNEGSLRWDSGYLYVSVVYNTSICLSLYCLAMFWMCINDDLKPFRPVPKFLCVKGILFFSFWQALGISILVAAGVITKLGPYTDSEYISLGLTDTLVCLEMPLFAIAHMYAFAYTDFIDPHRAYVARMPVYYAFRDAFGLLDVIEDSKATLRGEGMDYREFEPSEGIMHQGDGRERRLKAGLRYAHGPDGQRKYWLPRPNEGTQPPGRFERRVNKAIKHVAGADQAESVYAPLIGDAADDVVHLAPDMLPENEGATSIWGDPQVEDDGYELPFGDPDPADDELFAHSRKFMFGDYNYPCIDVSSEGARNTMWDEEERILRDERGAWGVKGPMKQTGIKWQGYGAVDTLPRRTTTPQSTPPTSNARIDWIKNDSRQHSRSNSLQRTNSGSAASSPVAESSSAGAKRHLRIPQGTPPALSRSHSNVSASPLPPDAVDLIVEDDKAAELDRTRERRKGEPAVRGAALRKVYRQGFVAHDDDGNKQQGQVEVENEYEEEDGRDGDRRVEAGADLAEAVGDDDEDGSQGEVDLNPSDSRLAVDEVITREMTPPLHARVFVDKFNSPGTDSDDANPWA